MSNYSVGDKIGYSLAMFASNSGKDNWGMSILKTPILYQTVMNADVNGDGVININKYKDKNGKIIDEMQLVKDDVRRLYGVEFSFDNLTPSTVKEIKIYENGKQKYFTLEEVNNSHRYSLSSTNKVLNDYDSNMTNYKNKQFKIGYVSESDYQKSITNIQQQEAKINNFIDNLQNKLGDKYSLNKEFSNGKGYVSVTINSEMTLSQIRDDFKLNDGVLINENPELRKLGDTPSWWDRHFNGAKTNYDSISINQRTIKIPVAAINVDLD